MKKILKGLFTILKILFFLILLQAICIFIANNLWVIIPLAIISIILVIKKI